MCVYMCACLGVFNCMNSVCRCVYECVSIYVRVSECLC